MAKYRVRAEAMPGHTGHFRGGQFWPSSGWKIVDLTPAQARVLEADPRLMVELGEGTKNAAAAKSEAIEVAKELDAEKKAHAETKAELELVTSEVERLTDAIATAKKETADAKAEAETLKDRIREDAKKAEAEAKAAAEAKKG